MKRLRSTSALTLGLGLLSILLAASPAHATTDAYVENPEPLRDAAVQNDPVPDAEVGAEPPVDVGVPGAQPEQQEVVRVCAAVPGALGSPDLPTRVTLPIDLAWARSTSVMVVTAELARESDFQPEQVHVRVVGEPWARFQSLYWAEGAGDCMEDTPCPEAAPLLDAELPALDRFPAPFELELAQDGGEAAAIATLCVTLTATGSMVPTPEVRGADAGEAAPPIDAPDASPSPASSAPEADIETPAEAAPDGDSESPAPEAGEAEKSGCSATAAPGRPTAALWLLAPLAALARRRRFTAR